MPMGRRPEGTLWWAGAHSACAAVAPFRNLILPATTAPRGTAGRSRVGGEGIQTAGWQRQLLRLCVGSMDIRASECVSLLVLAEIQAPDWLAVDSAAEGLRFVHTQLPLSAVEGPSPESHPRRPLGLSHGSRRWMWMIWSRRPSSISQQSKSLESLCDLQLSGVPVAPEPFLDIVLSGKVFPSVVLCPDVAEKPWSLKALDARAT